MIRASNDLRIERSVHRTDPYIEEPVCIASPPAMRGSADVWISRCADQPMPDSVDVWINPVHVSFDAWSPA